MKPILTKELLNYIGVELILKENNNESIVVLDGIRCGWVRGKNKTKSSYFEILIGAKEDESAPKYYLK